MLISECKVGQRVYLCPYLVRKIQPIDTNYDYAALGTILYVGSDSIEALWDRGRYRSAPVLQIQEFYKTLIPAFKLFENET